MTDQSNRNQWSGRLVTTVAALILAGSSAAKIFGAPRMVGGLLRAGIPAGAIVPIAILELACLVLYLLPRTAPLGTLLLTGYFGGATVAHLISGERLVPPLIIGLIIWAGAYLRVPAFRALFAARSGGEDARASYSRPPNAPAPTHI